MRNSAGNEGEPDPPTLAVKKRRKKNSNEAQQTPATSPKKNRHASQRQEPEDDHTHPVDIQTDSTKIALPFADTPIIRRNQEMRRGTIGGSRRSSLGMRGRRASSLIDAGKSNGKEWKHANHRLFTNPAKHYRMTKSKRTNFISISKVKDSASRAG